jgi:hypothetical protein
MKINLIGPILVVLLLASALFSVWVGFNYYFSTRELQRLQASALDMSTRLNAAQSLANEAIEYSKRNPAIDPILFQFELKARPVAASPAPAPNAAAPRSVK